MIYEEQDLTDSEVLRKIAEEKLKMKQIISSSANKEIDVKRLVHELQVHQIELEMQNEELRLANERAETTLKKYSMMYDFAPIGFFTLDQDALISELNFTGAEMLGDRRFSLVNSNFKLFISEESLEVFNNFLNKVFTSSSKESCEVKLDSGSTHLSNVYIEGIFTGDDRQCLISVVDVMAFNKQNSW